MIGDEDDDEMRIVGFHGFEQNHIGLEVFDRADDHFTFFDIELFQEIYIAGITIDARYFPTFEMRDDSRTFVDDENPFVLLFQTLVEVTSEFSVSEEYDIRMFLIYFYHVFVSTSWYPFQDRFDCSIDFLSIEDEITRCGDTDQSHHGDHGQDIWIFDLS